MCLTNSLDAALHFPYCQLNELAAQLSMQSPPVDPADMA